MTETWPVVQMVPIEKIHVLNPRSRNKSSFQAIVSNSSNLGLKKHITVTLRDQPLDGKRYNLVCGEGRLEAYAALGQAEIPAIVKDAWREECFLMSLVENIARRRYTLIELLREITSLKSRGYGVPEIAKKIDVGKSYVAGIRPGGDFSSFSRSISATRTRARLTAAPRQLSWIGASVEAWKCSPKSRLAGDRPGGGAFESGTSRPRSAPVLSSEEARDLIRGIDASTVGGFGTGR